MAITTPQSNTYVVMDTHTPAECSKVENLMKDNKNNLLAKTFWGCDFGDHTTHTIMEARNVNEIKSQLPPLISNRAKISQVLKHTAEQIEAMHASSL